ncbi:MAG: transpeptidase family protein [Bdellovibrionales bacterium]|nr:transpeptidase family protein [Bdellovibrionales bacterium]
MTGTESAAGRGSARTRLFLLGTAVTLFASAVVLRAFWVQVAGDERLAKLAERQFHSKVLIRPRRGLITDRHGQALAVNLEAKSLAAHPGKVSRPKATAGALSRALGIPFKTLEARLSSGKSFVWIKRHLSERDFERLKFQGILARDGALRDGFWLVEEARRVYPHGTLGSQLLGGVNVDLEGIEGVELWQDQRLRGEVVSVDAYKDALGRPTFIDAVAARHVRDGADVRLTIDAPLQYAVERSLRTWVANTQSEAGSVIVMDAETGELLAIANAPEFDPNSKGGRMVHRRRNRSVTDAYEPGSTMKPLLMASALVGGWKPQDEIWGGKGKFVVQGRTISEAEETEQFEWITLEDMIQKSSNVVSAKLALKLGAKNYVGFLKSFGFGVRTGIGFPGEIPGRLPQAEGMQPLTLANIGFGQGFLATRIQIVRAFAAIANGGFLVTPRLLLDATAPPAAERVIPDRVSKAVTRAMIKATDEDATGFRARFGEYVVAGKTGTAQTVDPQTKAYSRTKFIASFVGFAAGVGRPIVIFTSLDHPKGQYYASEIAAPLFSEVLAEVARRNRLPAPERIADRLSRAPRVSRAAPIREAPPESEPEEPREGQTAVDPLVAQENESVEPESAPDDLRRMPALSGLSAREVIRRLAEQGDDFKVEMRGFGLVRRQSPPAGSVLGKGARVSVLLEEMRR